jgi:hypothetical protein
LRYRFRTLAALTAAGVVASLGVVAVPAAHAGPTILTGAKNSLGQVGSDTTYWMMAGVAPQYNVNTTKNLDGDFVTEVPPLNTAPFPAGASSPTTRLTSPFQAGYLWNSLTSGSADRAGTGNAARRLVGGITASTRHDRPGGLLPSSGRTPVRTTLDFWAYARCARLRGVPRHAARRT